MAKHHTQRGEMAPAHDRKRTSQVKVTDYERTGLVQGQGYAVTRIETTDGSRC